MDINPAPQLPRLLQEGQGDAEPTTELKKPNAQGEETLAPFPQRNPYIPGFLILTIEMCERIAYYTVAGTVRTFLTSAAKFAGPQATSLQNSFGMIGWAMCLPGGWAGDNFGLYPTILASCGWYVIGILLATFAAIPTFKSGPLFLVGTMLFITIGMGGIKANISNFGADQFDPSDPRTPNRKKSYFLWFYMMINVGGFAANMYFSTLATSGLGLSADMKQDGYLFAYGITAGCMSFAAMLFLAGTPLYSRKQPDGQETGLAVCAKVLCKAAFGSQDQLLAGQINPAWRRKAQLATMGWALIPIFFLLAFLGGLPFPGDTGDILTYTALVLGSISVLLVVLTHIDNSFLEAGASALSSAPGAFTAEEVKKTFSIVPMLLVTNLGFNMCYNAMNTTMPNQACLMNLYSLPFLFGKTQANGNLYASADSIAIILLTPVFEYCIFPVWMRLQGGRSVKLSHKIVLGLIFVIIANIVAAVLEIKRRASPILINDPSSNCADGKMSDMSANWMFIPMSLIGVGEILFNPALYHFVYASMPMKVRSTVFALNLLFAGSISGAFTTALSLPLTPKDFNTGHLEYLYFVNIGMTFASIFLYFAVRHAMRKVGSQTNCESFVPPVDEIDGSEAPDDGSLHIRSMSLGL